MNTLQKLVTIANDPAVRDSLWQQVAQARSQYEETSNPCLHEEYDQQFACANDDAYIGRMAYERTVLQYSGSFRRVLDEFWRKLPQPCALTLWSIQLIAEDQFAGLPSENDFPAAYQRFIGLIAMRLARVPAGNMTSFNVEGLWSRHEASIEDDVTITSDGGFEITISFEVDNGDRTEVEDEEDLLGVRPVCSLFAGCDLGFNDSRAEKFADCAASVLESIRLVSAAIDGSKYGRTEDLNAKTTGPFLTRCLVALETKPGSGDEFRTRLQDAVRRLEQADAAVDYKLKAMLSILAVENLLCSGRGRSKADLCCHAAALLETEGACRQDLIERLYQLYEICSSFSKFEARPCEIANRARTFAAGVLIAVCDWLDHAHRTGADASFEAFMQELEIAASQGKRLAGLRRKLHECVTSAVLTERYS